MFVPKRLVALAVCLLPTLAPTAQATTIGLPIITTEPGTIFFVNQFGPDLAPTPSFTMTYNGFIASALGAAELVGKSIDFTWFFDGGFNDQTVFTRLFIDGTDLQATNDNADQYRILTLPPVAGDTPTSTPGVSLWTYLSPFNGFGPRASGVPDVELYLSIGGAIPTRTGYTYCRFADPTFCEFSTEPGLTVLNGFRVFEDGTVTYPEGRLDNATLTFSTIDGRSPAAVPVPAAGVMLAMALGGLAVAARRRRAA